MSSRYLLRFIIIAILCLSGVLPSNASQALQVDRVIVNKTDRQLHLMQGNNILRTYPVSLGKNPLGHKVRKGDKRTPEGRYQLDWRNKESRYHLSMHISYPSRQDRQTAAKKGVQPGGDIMIHGLPAKYADGEGVLLDLDWTDGCIAVSNQAIEEIWQLVANNTIIDIIP